MIEAIMSPSHQIKIVLDKGSASEHIRRLVKLWTTNVFYELGIIVF